MSVKKNKTIKKKITLEDLAAMTQRGFADMSGRFDRVEKDVSILKQDVSTLKQDVSILKQDVLEIKGTLASFDRRLMFLEDKITEHSKEIRKLRESIEKLLEERSVDHEKIVWLEKRIEILEAKAGIRAN